MVIMQKKEKLNIHKNKYKIYSLHKTFVVFFFHLFNLILFISNLHYHFFIVMVANHIYFKSHIKIYNTHVLYYFLFILIIYYFFSLLFFNYNIKCQTGAFEIIIKNITA